MSQYRVLRAARAVPAAVAAGLVALLVIAATATAATAPVTPESFTNCGGKVAADHAGKAQAEPYLVDYSFHCDGPISAYTVIVEQQGDPSGSVDDFGPSPSEFQSDGTTPNPSGSTTCEGTTPSDGINCNFGAGGSLPTGDVVKGSIDPVAPYCPHVTAPAAKKKSKKGHKAKATKTAAKVTPVPRALVALVVTDATGAQDGPFILGPAKACGHKPVVVPASTTKTTRQVRS